MLNLSEFEKELLSKTQDGVPLVKEPYKEIANELDVSAKDVIETYKKLLKENKIRKFGASINHRKIGFSANAMIVWDIPDEELQEIANKINSFDYVSHCYERPRKSDWDYNLFTMIHGETKDECEEMAEEISSEVGINKYELLYSTREFKKSGVKIP